MGAFRGREGVLAGDFRRCGREIEFQCESGLMSFRFSNVNKPGILLEVAAL